MPTARIMLVEDERIVALHLQVMLESFGHEVVANVASGKEALQKIEETRPDLVLMDVNIEGEIDGIETAARIPPDYHVAIVYLTAYSEDGTLERARATKPHGYLLKPFSERELRATLEMVLERSGTERALRKAEERLRQAQKMEVVGSWPAVWRTTSTICSPSSTAISTCWTRRWPTGPTCARSCRTP